MTAGAIPLEQANRVVYCMSGESDVSKQRDCVPHDVGDPGECIDEFLCIAAVFLLKKLFVLISGTCAHSIGSHEFHIFTLTIIIDIKKV